MLFVQLSLGKKHHQEGITKEKIHTIYLSSLERFVNENLGKFQALFYGTQFVTNVGAGRVILGINDCLEAKLFINV